MALLKAHLIHWKVMGLENAYKGGRGDRTSSEPMGVQGSKNNHGPHPRMSCHFHISTRLRLFLDFSPPTGTEQVLYCLLPSVALEWPNSLNLPISVTHFLPTHHFTSTLPNSVPLNMEAIYCSEMLGQTKHTAWCRNPSK
jgi:hypothetical protein